jgi:hypothetical protein
MNEVAQVAKLEASSSGRTAQPSCCSIADKLPATDTMVLGLVAAQVITLTGSLVGGHLARKRRLDLVHVNVKLRAVSPPYPACHNPLSLTSMKQQAWFELKPYQNAHANTLHGMESAWSRRRILNRCHELRQVVERAVVEPINDHMCTVIVCVLRSWCARAWTLTRPRNVFCCCLKLCSWHTAPAQTPRAGGPPVRPS